LDTGTNNGVAGTPFASPTVAGTAANLKHALVNLGKITTVDGLGLMSAVLVTGDSCDGSQTPMDEVADIDIQVVDSCAGNAIMASQTAFDLRNRVRLLQGNLTGKCPRLRISGWNVPQNGRQVGFIR